MAFGTKLIAEEEQVSKREPVIFKILDIKFISPDNNFFIAVAETKTKNGIKQVSLKGNMKDFNYSWINKELECAGEFYEDSWGPGFKASLVTPVMPKTANSFVKFFSDKVKGVGRITLEKISNEFGEDSLDVLSNYPEKLLQFIDMDKAHQLFDFWQQEKTFFDLKIYLGKHGLNESQISSVIDVHGQNILKKVKKDPYIIMDIDGIGFKSADYFALSIGLDVGDPLRIRAATEHFLQQAINNDGSTIIKKSDFVQKVKTELRTTENLIEKCLESLEKNEKIVTLVLSNKGSDNVYLSTSILNKNEEVIAEYSNSLLNSNAKPIKGIKFKDKRLDDDQKAAVKKAFDEKMCIITGGPGTGKTSIISEIIHNCEKNGLQVIQMAFAGKAAKRMEEATGMKSGTIHRTYGFNPSKITFNDDGFNVNEKKPLRCDVVIIDECSMIDTHLMASALKGIPVGARVVLVGDVDQLPSVGPGEVFKNMIDSGVIPVSKLTKIYRQAEGSDIVEASQAINKGEVPNVDTKQEDEFHFIQRGVDNQAIYNEVMDQVRYLLDKGVNKEDIQIITPQWNQIVGVSEMNETLKHVFNKEWDKEFSGDREKNSKITLSIRKGDRVMQTKNNPENDIYNGDVGTVIASDINSMLVDFNKDEPVEIKKDGMKNIMLSYAYTVHKSQGSEMPYVIMPLSQSHRYTLNRQVLYTAVSRAKKQFIMIGDTGVLKKTISKKNLKHRDTCLIDKLKKIVKLEPNENQKKIETNKMTVF